MFKIPKLYAFYILLTVNLMNLKRFFLIRSFQTDNFLCKPKGRQ